MPDFVIDRMLSRFQIPAFYEGFDQIWFHSTGELMNFDQMLDGFMQDNPHHSLSLQDHLQIASMYFVNDPVLEETAKWHDIGKLFTKSFVDAKGNPSEIAHFYGHENYGAYLYLLNNTVQATSYVGTQFLRDAVPYKALLINWHMRPYEWDKNPHVKEKDERLIGHNAIVDLEKLHAADIAAH